MEIFLQNKGKNSEETSYYRNLGIDANQNFDPQFPFDSLPDVIDGPLFLNFGKEDLRNENTARLILLLDDHFERYLANPILKNHFGIGVDPPNKSTESVFPSFETKDLLENIFADRILSSRFWFILISFLGYLS